MSGGAAKEKMRLLFAITQFFKGGAEIALLNLFCALSPEEYEIDFVILNQLDIPGAISLVDRLPPHVKLIDAVRLCIGGKPATQPPPPRRLQKALGRAVCKKHYHWAFHIGEWSSPEFVATRVWADHKAAWIHNDLNAAEYFDAEAFFRWDAWFEHYLFVSERTREKSCAKYPRMLAKSNCVHNLLNNPEILDLAARPLGEDERYFEQGLPVLVTCANVRPQKNHLRQAQAMALLQKEGFDFIWLNVGTMPDAELAEALRAKIDELGIGERFVLLGGRDNPYPYMLRASAFALVSDYESWPMVLGEALLLGAPVLATKTSGALAQITQENGLLVDFSTGDIAAGIKAILAQKKPRRVPVQGAERQKQPGLAEFESLLNPGAGRRSVVYLIDDINYQSGVQKASFAQMRALGGEYDIRVYSPVPPGRQVLNDCPCRFLWPDVHRLLPHFYLRSANVLAGPFPLRQKWAKLRQVAAGLLGRGITHEKALQTRALKDVLESFDVAVALSETSALRGLAAGLQKPKKVQWIHTDYAGWRHFDEFAENASKNDAELYQNFDAIVTISPRCRESFISVHPHLADKTIVVANLLPKADILRQAARRNWYTLPEGLRLITVGRLYAEKNHMPLLTVAKRLHEAGLPFCWYIVGGGSLFPDMQQFVDKNGLDDAVCLTGQLQNVYPLMARADLIVHFSHYEGAPLTIREAQMLGVPALAKPVGGIPDIIEEGQNGLFVQDADALYEAIMALAGNSARLAALKEGAKTSRPGDEDTLHRLRQLFGAQGG